MWLADVSFNPCSGGLEMAARPTARTAPPGSRVSILVLVDWRWRLYLIVNLMLTPWGFQSLFWWIGDGGHTKERKAAK